MPGAGPDPQELHLRELDLKLREAELDRREIRLIRAAGERALELDAREEQLNRRESSVVVLAGELAAERERLSALRAQALDDLKRLERRQVQSAPRALAIVPPPEERAADKEWWTKVLGRTPASTGEAS